MLEQSAVVLAYWALHRLQAEDRESCLQAEAGELAWARDVVNEAAKDGSDDVLTLFDAHLQDPGADPCYLGAGTVEELLVHHGTRFDGAIGELCRQSERMAGGGRLRVAGRRRGATAPRSPVIPATRR